MVWTASPVPVAASTVAEEARWAGPPRPETKSPASWRQHCYPTRPFGVAASAQSFVEDSAVSHNDLDAVAAEAVVAVRLKVVAVVVVVAAADAVGAAIASDDTLANSLASHVADDVVVAVAVVVAADDAAAADVHDEDADEEVLRPWSKFQLYGRTRQLWKDVGRAMTKIQFMKFLIPKRLGLQFSEKGLRRFFPPSFVR